MSDSFFSSGEKRAAFSAYISADQNNVTGDGTSYTVLYQTKIVDTTASYNTATGIFTAPLAGNYMFYGSLLISGLLASHTSMLIDLNDTVLNYNLVKLNSAAIRVSGQIALTWTSHIMALGVGSQVSTILTVANGTKVVGLPQFLITSTFSGNLIL